MKYLFTDRFRGFSSGNYDSLNLALHVGDNPKHVRLNKELLAEKMDVKNLVFMNQIHGDCIEIITAKNRAKSMECDGMITNLKDTALCVMVADCMPLLFYDPLQKVIAVAHAGRNGVYLKIANKIIEIMMSNFNCHVKNIKVFIGPSIKSCCYEVKNDVTKGFENYLHVKGGKIYLDIVQKCIDDLKDIGIYGCNIDISPICTCCDENYFSYRRSGVTGRFCGAIKL